MQLTYQGQTHSVDAEPADRTQAISAYAVPADYHGGFFVAVTPAGRIEQVPASRGSETTLLLRGALSPGEPLAVEYLAEGVTLG